MAQTDSILDTAFKQADWSIESNWADITNNGNPIPPHVTTSGRLWMELTNWKGDSTGYERIAKTVIILFATKCILVLNAVECILKTIVGMGYLVYSKRSDSSQKCKLAATTYFASAISGVKFEFFMVLLMINNFYNQSLNVKDNYRKICPLGVKINDQVETYEFSESEIATEKAKPTTDGKAKSAQQVISALRAEKMNPKKIKISSTEPNTLNGLSKPQQYWRVMAPRILQWNATPETSCMPFVVENLLGSAIAWRNDAPAPIDKLVKRVLFGLSQALALPVVLALEIGLHLALALGCLILAKIDGSETSVTDTWHLSAIDYLSMAINSAALIILLPLMSVENLLHHQFDPKNYWDIKNAPNFWSQYSLSVAS